MNFAILTHPDLPGVEVSFVKITSEIATEYLTHNTEGQRNLSPITVQKYVSDMLELAWPFTGAPILFDDKGQLIDGQHRLRAIEESDEPQVTLVIRGLDADTIAAIDNGRRRTFSDLLRMRDKAVEPITVAATITRVAHWRRGNYVRSVPRIPNAQWTNWYPTAAQLDAIKDEVEAELEITFQQAALEGKRIGRSRPGITASIYAMAWVLLSEVDKDLREQFFFEFTIEPKSPSATYPVNVLSNTLARRQQGRKAGEIGLTDVQQMHYLFTAFNAWVQGKDISILKTPAQIRWDTVAQPAKNKD
jgi:hypothetical protein